MVLLRVDKINRCLFKGTAKVTSCFTSNGANFAHLIFLKNVE